MNGVSLTGLDNVGDTVEHAFEGMLSGILADGQPFVFSQLDRDFVVGDITLRAATLPAIGPTMIHASSDEVPSGVRNGQSLIVDEAGVVAGDFNAGPGSKVYLQPGGVIGANFEADGAEVVISGGVLGDGFAAFADSKVTISGGQLGKLKGLSEGAELHIIGTEFFADGVPISQLESHGDSLVFEQRSNFLDLTGTLQDGSFFDFDLVSETRLANVYGSVYIDPAAILRLTLALTDTLDCDFDGNDSCDAKDVDLLFAAMATNDLVFDINGSGVVDLADLDTWLSSAGNAKIGRAYLPGDVTLDGTVDPEDLNVLGLHWQLDVSSWSQGDLTGDGRVDVADLNRIGQHWLQAAAAPTAATVPEPSGFVLGTLGLLLLCRRLR